MKKTFAHRFSSHIYHLPDPTTTEAETEQKGKWVMKATPIPWWERKAQHQDISHKKNKPTLLVAVTIAEEHGKEDEAKSTPHKQLLLIDTIQPNKILPKFIQPPSSKHSWTPCTCGCGQMTPLSTASYNSVSK